MTAEEQVRFHNLLKMAKESPFEGERENALAAAERLAQRRGLTLEEAALRQAQPAADPTNQQTQAERDRVREMAAHVHMTDYQIHLEKQRRDTARREAEQRGLDRREREAAEKRKAAQSSRRAPRSTARMAPDKHAWALVRETQLSYREIARITGLDIYEVLHMKIQLLRAA